MKILFFEKLLWEEEYEQKTFVTLGVRGSFRLFTDFCVYRL